MNETYDVIKAHELMENLQKEIYPEVNEYLCGTQNSEQRHIKLSTLEVFKVGIGMEPFRNEEGALAKQPSIYFPMYQPTAS